jgi:SSS family solute:Na+ symporter
MNGLDIYFSSRDWGIVAVCLVVTVAATRFFRGGRKGAEPDSRPLPWPIVGASLVLSELTGWLFLSVPGVMLAIHGNLAYVQWMVVSLLVRIVIGFLLMRRGWSLGGGESSPEECGSEVRPLRTPLAFLSHFGSWLGLALRLLVLVLPLALLTGWSFERCLLLLVASSALLVCTGRIRAVAQVESIHLLCLVSASAVVFSWLAGVLPDDWSASLEKLRQSENFEGAIRDKLAIWDFRSDPAMEFTFWTALLCFPFYQCQALTLDRGNLLRLRLCADARAAGRAVFSSSLALIVILLLLATGLALFLVYRAQPPEDPMILRALAWTGGEPARYDLALSIWILTELPEGTRGLIFGAFFAASLTGVQASFLSLPGLPGRSTMTSVVSAVLWGLAGMILVVALLHYQSASGIGLLSLGYGLAAFTVGPLIGLYLLAARGRDGVRPIGAMVGVILSLVLVLLNRLDLWELLFGHSFTESLERLPDSLLIVERSPSITSFVASAWLWPITALLTWVGGWRKCP